MLSRKVTNPIPAAGTISQINLIDYSIIIPSLGTSIVKSGPATLFAILLMPFIS